MKPKRIKLRAFVEGVEIPIVSAVVSSQANAPATASIQIVPADTALEFLPRSLVHVFFHDFVDGPGDNIHVGGSGVDKVELGLDSWEKIKHKYRLLFVGEIVGFGYMKTKGSRQLILQCVDLSNYWDACYYFKRGWSYQAQFAGASFKTLNDWMYGTSEVIVEKLNTPPAGHKNVVGLVGGLIHLLQAVGGVYRNDTKIKGTNVFFSLAELRLGLSRIIAAPIDDTPKKLLKKAGFGSIWKKTIRGLGREFNFRRAIVALQRYIFYEVFPNPCSMIVPADESALEDESATRLADHPKWKWIIDEVNGFLETMNVYFGYLDNASALSDPDREMLMDEMVTGLIYVEKRLGFIAQQLHAEAPTAKSEIIKNEKQGVYYTSSDPVSLATPEETGLIGTSFEPQQSVAPDVILDQEVETERVVGYKTTKVGGLMKVRSKVITAQKKVRAARDECRTKVKAKAGVQGIEGVETPPKTTYKKGSYVHLMPSSSSPKGKKIYKKLDKAEGHVREILGLTIKGKRAGSLIEPMRLANQLFRPDPWFVSPPRCNVIFPDQYTRISYNRNFTSEVTRLLMRTSDSFGGGELMFDNFYYAPHVQGVIKGNEVAYKKAKEVGLGYMVSNRDIMDHELFTGIVPRFERAKGLKIFGIRSGKVVAGDKKTKVGYAQRLTNFLFFKYRYAGRVTNVSCVFNPYLVPGFPALLLDRYLDSQKAADVTLALEASEGDLSAIRGMTGTHFLGVIATLTHSISQSSAGSSLQLSYSRTHREHIDPVGADKIKAKAIKGGKQKKYRVCSLPDFAPQVDKDHGLFGGRVEASTPVPNDTGSHPLWNSPPGRKKGKVFTYVQGNTRKKAKQHGVETISLAGDSEAFVTYSVYDVVEVTEKTEKRIIDMPFEDIVRPAWYGDIWTNRVVGGAVYQELVGTGSITDPIVITDRERTYSQADADVFSTLSDKSTTSDEFNEKAFSLVISDLEDNATVENAIDFLVYTYSQVKRGGYDPDEFIRSYTWRPIASMYDMFGSDNLEYDEEGNRIIGVEGFHSKAFGQFENLFAFADQDVREILGVSRNKKGTFYVGSKEVYKTEEPLSKRLDVRKRRQDKVIDYVFELEKKGILG